VQAGFFLKQLPLSTAMISNPSVKLKSIGIAPGEL
jgi:hypothetical protein